MPKHRAPYDRSKRPLGAAKLDELALAYVARFATSRAKLTRYLSRKVRESEWIDDSDAMAACAAIADRMEHLRYLDDRQYAAMRAGAMTRRGLGARRVKAQLYADGIAEQDSGAAIEAAEGAA
ncbi:MAG TPA: RecX family transcriptional regulator, partial [Sphingopyxis sp.]|nr:RecX family transcriptional regulator [Sphingopyxis sp.]